MADASEDRPTTPTARLRRALLAHGWLLVVALAAVVRFATLGAESLWTDELITLDFVTANGPLELLWVIPLNQPHLPVYYVLLDLWTALAGTSEAALRFPSAVFGVAAVAALYALGTTLFDRRVGLLAATVLALSRFHVYHSQEVRMYSLLTLLTVVSYLLLVRVRDGDDRRDRVGYLFVTLALLYTHPFALFVVAAQGTYLLGRWLHREGWPPTVPPRWRLPALGVTLAVAPLLVGALLRGRSATYSYIPPPTPRQVVGAIAEHVGYAGAPRWVLFAGLALSGAVVAVGLVDARGAFGRWRGARGSATTLAATVRRLLPRDGESENTALVLLWFLGPLLVPVVVSYLVTPVFWPRYTIAASPALFVLMAKGVRDIPRPPLRAVVALLLVCSLLPGVVQYHTTTQKEEWDEVGATLDERAEAGDFVLVADRITRRGVDHYSARAGEDLVVRDVIAVDSGTGYAPTPNETIREMVEGRDRVWVVFSHITEDDRERVLDHVERDHTRTWERSFVGIDLYLYERAPEAQSVETVDAAGSDRQGTPTRAPSNRVMARPPTPASASP
ncbi:glycosyltransferase family 39 protein [Halomarina ordinaria]|uniref:Glycosyltransferase family 39 protein n=1 Tax=Halomarina ordinaria TaxID=3033939 RepID=A0ABD5UD50_9EURY|nr:glycosyltransferase family 39 protein [Halomarina sp. PSRA2]